MSGSRRSIKAPTWVGGRGSVRAAKGAARRASTSKDLTTVCTNAGAPATIDVACPPGMNRMDASPGPHVGARALKRCLASAAVTYLSSRALSMTSERGPTFGTGLSWSITWWMSLRLSMRATCSFAWARVHRCSLMKVGQATWVERTPSV